MNDMFEKLCRTKEQKFSNKKHSKKTEKRNGYKERLLIPQRTLEKTRESYSTQKDERSIYTCGGVRVYFFTKREAKVKYELNHSMCNQSEPKA